MVDCAQDTCEHRAMSSLADRCRSAARRRAGVCVSVLLLLTSCAVERAGLGDVVNDDAGHAIDGGQMSVADLGTAIDLGGTHVDRDLGAPDLDVARVDLGQPDLGVLAPIDLGPPPMPCGGACTASETCVLAACVTCGGGLQPCCPMARCIAGHVCALGVGCARCGGPRELCCAGGICNGGLSCSSIGFCG